MVKVYLDTKPLVGNHAVRGIGTYTRNLEQELGKSRDVKLIHIQKDADLVHLSYFDLFFNTLKVDKNVPTIVTIYDVIPLIYPKQYPPGIRGRLNFLRQKKELAKVAAIITISETSKKDIVRFLDVPPGKVHPVHLAPGHDFKKLEIGNWKLEIVKRYGLPERFVLYVGDVNYNKNLPTLAAACKKIGTPLVVCGKQAVAEDVDWSHPENKPFYEFIEKYGSDPFVRRVGFVPDENLVKIYNLATVYCQPSFYEGFGLPVLEAMACGTPAVLAQTQALSEIAEGVAIFVDPKDGRDVAAGLKKVFDNPGLQGELSKKGMEHVKHFSWSKTADETIQIYQRVAK